MTIDYGIVDWVNLVVFLGVIVLAVSKGGRYERYVALLFIFGWFGATLGQKVTDEAVPLATLTALNLVQFVVLGWLVTRHRPGWLVVLLVVEGLYLVNNALRFAGVVPSSNLFYLNISAGLGDVQLVTLVYAVLRRRLGPPFPAPAAAAARPAQAREASGVPGELRA